MDKKTLEFVTYCIGKLSVLLQLPQKEIYKRLKTSGILYDYIVPSYDVLHNIQFPLSDGRFNRVYEGERSAAT